MGTWFQAQFLALSWVLSLLDEYAGRHRGMITNEHIKIISNSYEKVKTFKYLGKYKVGYFYKRPHILFNKQNLWLSAPKGPTPVYWTSETD